MTADIFLHIVARFLHIGSVILLLGGIAYSRQVLVPALELLEGDMRLRIANDSQRRFRTTLWTLLSLIVISGFYNYFTYSGPRHTSAYQMWFGIKFLLVLHVVATAILWSTSAYRDASAIGKSKRRLISLMISGFCIVLISAYLRSLSQRGL